MSDLRALLPSGSIGEALRFDASQQVFVARAAEQAASTPHAYLEVAPGDGTLYRFYTWFPIDRRGQIVAGSDKMTLLDPGGNGWHRNYVPETNPLLLPWDDDLHLADHDRWDWIPVGNRKTEAVIALFCWYLARAQAETPVAAVLFDT